VIEPSELTAHPTSIHAEAKTMDATANAFCCLSVKLRIGVIV
jgi:hypothetical protein